MGIKIPSFLGKRATPAPEVEFQFATAPDPAGWRVMREDPRFTCFPPASGPFVDQGVLRAIREFYPGCVPIWKLQRWLPPNSSRTVTVARISLGGYESDPVRYRMPLRCDLPIRWSGPRPNMLGMPLDVPSLAGGPSDPIPFDWRVYYLARAAFVADPELADEGFLEAEERRAALLDQQEASARDDARYKEKKRQEILDFYNPAECDWNDYYQALADARERSQRRGVGGNPFVHVGRSAA
jgi:hypothetical protein